MKTLAGRRQGLACPQRPGLACPRTSLPFRCLKKNRAVIHQLRAVNAAGASGPEAAAAAMGAAAARELLNVMENVQTALTPPAETAKNVLLEAVAGTGRGRLAGAFQRGMIEEAQVAVEAFSGPELDWPLLAGKWKLVYTTALDVLPILDAEYWPRPPFGPPLVDVGEIYQRFTTPEEGVIENIIEVGLLPGGFSEARNGVTFTVGARYEVCSPHRIALEFEEARVSSVRLAPLAESLLAPALLPRTWLTHRVLLAIKEFQLRVPFRSLQQVASSAGGVQRRGPSPAASYQLTYLDKDMLIGRASILGGTFVFVREEEAAH